MPKPVGTLERAELREAWRHEAAEFTPWLAQPENLARLADTLGLDDLVLLGTEHPIGDFKLDILCEDADGPVIIENQLERTNHAHLGQILTYAAGVGARKVIWIAESLRTEHTAALEFLNEHTTEELSFFGVEVEVWRIGDSPLAPRFNVVAKPNDWARSGREDARVARDHSPARQLRLRFWTGWKEWREASQSPTRASRPSARPYSDIVIGVRGAHLVATTHSRERRLAVDLYINHERSKEVFDALHATQGAIESALGTSLDWQKLTERHACRIWLVKPDAPLESEDRWNEYFAWLDDTARRMQRVFAPYLVELL